MPRIEIEIDPLCAIGIEPRADDFAHAAACDAFRGANVDFLREMRDARDIFGGGKDGATDASAADACTRDDFGVGSCIHDAHDEPALKASRCNEAFKNHLPRAHFITIKRNRAHDIDEHSHRVLSATARTEDDRAHIVCFAGIKLRGDAFHMMPHAHRCRTEVQHIARAHTHRFLFTRWNFVDTSAVAASEIFDRRAVSAK